MRRLFAVAVVLLASTAAHAGETYNFDIGGHTIHIDPDRGIVSIPGVYESGPMRLKRSRANSDEAAPVRTSPSQANVDPQPSSEQQAPSNNVAVPSSSSANIAPRDPAPSAPPRAGQRHDIITGLRPSEPAVASAPATSAPVTTTVPVTTTAPVPAPVRQASSSSTTPLGVWLTEEKEGKVRIEQCGANLCGYSVNEKSDQNGEKILINMKPVSGEKWSGKIFDPKSGSTYDLTIAMKGSDGLRVQGCAFGGMFCGGQSWSRVN